MDAEPRLTNLLADVAARGPLVRRTTLTDLGHSPRTISAAVAAGALVTGGRLWVARPGVDPVLLNAAKLGVVLTCVSAAEHLGLWTIESPAVHVGVTSTAARRKLKPSTVAHWARPVMARHPDTHVDPIENVLVIAAGCLPREQALVIWESAMNKRLVDPQAFGRMHLPPRARALLSAASRFADSGLETIFRTRLEWLGERILCQTWLHGHRVDFLIGDRLVVQIDGGHHVGAQRTSDIRHDAELMLRGYHVIRVGYHQVMEDWPGVQDLIVRAVAQGLHRAAQPTRAQNTLSHEMTTDAAVSVVSS